MTVTPIGRLFFLVSSRSRKGLDHVADLEPNEYGDAPACSCEKNRLRGEPCHHLKAAVAYVQQEAASR